MRLETVDQVLVIGELSDDLELGLDGMFVLSFMDIDYFGDQCLSRIVLIVCLVDHSIASLSKFFLLGDVVWCSLQFLHPNFFFVIHRNR